MEEKKIVADDKTVDDPVLSLDYWVPKRAYDFLKFLTWTLIPVLVSAVSAVAFAYPSKWTAGITFALGLVVLVFSGLVSKKKPDDDKAEKKED
jgi:hypothetical protein